MLRNKEYRHFALCFALIAGVSITLGLMLSPRAGLYAALSAAAYGIAFYRFTRARYRSIAEISEQIDLVLHNADYLFISESEEGELSILQSEITKMTLRIREQNAALKKEKENLADSLADIAHQLRTPLTSVNLILSLLENNPEESERGELLREAEELLVRMDWLITSLLKLSRLDAGIVLFQSRQTDVRSLVNAALRPLLIPMELHSIDLQIDVPEGIQIWGDADWLAEAIRNILKNCMESAGDQGKIEISCRDNPLFRLRFMTAGRDLKKRNCVPYFNDSAAEKIPGRQVTGSGLRSAGRSSPGREGQSLQKITLKTARYFSSASRSEKLYGNNLFTLRNRHKLFSHSF